MYLTRVVYKDLSAWMFQKSVSTILAGLIRKSMLIVLIYLMSKWGYPTLWIYPNLPTYTHTHIKKMAFTVFVYLLPELNIINVYTS